MNIWEKLDSTAILKRGSLRYQAIQFPHFLFSQVQLGAPDNDDDYIVAISTPRHEFHIWFETASEKLIQTVMKI